MNKMIPSELIHADESGNVVIGKNLEVDGTTKLNGGLKAIHEYTFTNDGDECKLGIYFETYLSVLDAYNFIGYLTNSDGEKQLCLGQYFIDNGQLRNIYAWYFYDTQEMPVIQSWSSFDNTSSYDSPALNSKTQDKIYIHTLTLTADKSYTLVYESTNNLNVESIADLKTTMNVMTTSDNVILPVCATDLSGTAVLQVTTALCKIGTANVTAVSDKVTEM